MILTSRKGFEKVRTGCSTCKKRRVKCDEAKPNCLRCQSAGRECGGYSQPPAGSYSWNRLLQTQPSTIPTSGSASAELRGIDYFRCVVAPALSGIVDRRFWTSSALQVATQDGPAKFAALAISSLYENFEAQTCGTSTSARKNSLAEAVSNYNTALKRMSSTQCLEPNIALVTSILFICIEFLRGNSNTAIDHCRHSIHILNAHGGSPELLALFRHLNIFPYFFGANLANFPQLQDVAVLQDIPTLSQAGEALDCLMSQCVRLVRSFDQWRLGLAKTEIPLPIKEAQQELRQNLSKFLVAWNKIKSTRVLDPIDKAVCRVLEMRFLVCHIWGALALSLDETSYDIYFNEFKRIIELAREEASHRKQPKTQRSENFAFEMGPAPLLHFVVMKCRFLHLRLEGLRLLQILSYHRESSWDSRILYAIGKRMIEREHGIDISPSLDAVITKWSRAEASLPKDTERIRDSYLEGDELDYLDINGIRVARWVICFLMLDPNQEKPACTTVRDWIDLVPKP